MRAVFGVCKQAQCHTGITSTRAHRLIHTEHTHAYTRSKKRTYLCVVRRMLYLARAASTMSHSPRLLVGSSPVVGSSSITTTVMGQSARARVCIQVCAQEYVHTRASKEEEKKKNDKKHMDKPRNDYYFMHNQFPRKNKRVHICNLKNTFPEGTYEPACMSVCCACRLCVNYIQSGFPRSEMAIDSLRRCPPERSFARRRRSPSSPTSAMISSTCAASCWLSAIKEKN